MRFGRQAGGAESPVQVVDRVADQAGHGVGEHGDGADAVQARALDLQPGAGGAPCRAGGYAVAVRGDLARSE